MNAREVIAVDKERITYAVYGLLEDTIEPMFRGLGLEGILEDIRKQELCGTAMYLSREKAALSWMEDNYDSLMNALYAVSAMTELLLP